MKTFLLAQTGLNLLAAVIAKEAGGRLFCVAFGVWGAAEFFINYWN